MLPLFTIGNIIGWAIWFDLSYPFGKPFGDMIWTPVVFPVLVKPTLIPCKVIPVDVTKGALTVIMSAPHSSIWFDLRHSA